MAVAGLRAEAHADDTALSLRDVGRVRVLRALHESERISRPELVRRTGLSRATVAALIGDLMGNGIVSEVDSDGQAERRTGRPAQSLSIVPTAAFAAGVDIGHEHVAAVLCNVRGDPIWYEAVAKDVDRAAEQTLDLAADLVRKAIRDKAIPRERILGLGAGIASPVDRTSDALSGEGIMAGWVGLHPSRELEQRTGLPAQLINDANAGSLAERLYGAARNSENTIYVRLSAGIGAGIVADGQLLLGAGGLAGEVGHLQVDPRGRVCRCGNRGCLETVASPVAITRLLSDSWGRSVSTAELLELVAAGNRGAVRAVEDAGEVIGQCIATMVTLFDPELIVLGGDLAAAGDALLDPMRRSISRHAMLSASHGIRIVRGELGRQAEVRGAAGLVLARAPERLARSALFAAQRSG